MNEKDRSALWSGLNFDVSIYEIWSSLLSGGTLCIPDASLRTDETKYINWLKNQKITSAYIPPFMVEPLARHQQKAPIGFKRLLTGVEPIPEHLLCTIKKNTPGLCLINGYGPAEATICATLYVVPDESHHTVNAPIGTPVEHLDIHLLSADGTPVGPGEKGEIHIAGIQVAQGYLGKEALSNKHFLTDPFSSTRERPMYRTGDMGIRLADGNIVFSGRKDFQMKIRGFRIEPEEIESLLTTYPGIRHAAVILTASPSGRKRLMAYVDARVDEKKVMIFLSLRLPRYMMPATVVCLEKLPRTSQGKVDRHALMERKDFHERDGDLPTTPVEQQIAAIWESCLDLDPIYRNDDFLHLGGDSLSGIKILSRVNALFKTACGPQCAFQPCPP